MISVGILIASDKGSKGEREDLCGPLIKDMIMDLGWETKAYEIVPDEKKIISDKLIDYADSIKVDIILTSGGTGFSKRDITPEATLAVVERLAPGIPEAMRMESMKITPKAMLSRAVAGIRGETLIINMPGSPKAVKECFNVIIPALEHGIDILQGKTGECARKD